MAQKSWPWSTVAAIGDGAAQLTEALSREFLAAYFGVQDKAVEGISKGVLGELAVSGAASPLAVAAGSAICYGLYINDTATTTTAIATPAVGLTGGRVVLRTDWASATTRIAVVKSADGVAAIPALTQVFGTTWEISLATFTITTGGVITVTDARVFRRSTAVVGSAEIEAQSIATANLALDSVGNTILRNSAAVSVIGRSANSVGDPADIAAAGNDTLLSRVANALGFTQLTAAMFPAGVVATAALALLSVTTAKLALNSVDDTIVGDRVPQFYRRQGGSATDWNVAGTTTYTPGPVRVQGGKQSVGTTTITFPVAFSQPPLVVVTSHDFTYIVNAESVTATNFVARRVRPDGAPPGGNCPVDWMAIGPE